MPVLSLPGEGEGSIYPPVAVRPVSSFEWDLIGKGQTTGPRRRHGGVTVEPIIGGDVAAAYVRNVQKN